METANEMPERSAATAAMESSHCEAYRELMLMQSSVWQLLEQKFCQLRDDTTSPCTWSFVLREPPPPLTLHSTVTWGSAQQLPRDASVWSIFSALALVHTLFRKDGAWAM